MIHKNQILIDRHGHTLSHQLSDKNSYSISSKIVNQYAQKLILLAQ